jgi:hypothetical protein
MDKQSFATGEVAQSIFIKTSPGVGCTKLMGEVAGPHSAWNETTNEVHLIE